MLRRTGLALLVISVSMCLQVGHDNSALLAGAKQPTSQRNEVAEQNLEGGPEAVANRRRAMEATSQTNEMKSLAAKMQVFDKQAAQGKADAAAAYAKMAARGETPHGSITLPNGQTYKINATPDGRVVNVELAGGGTSSSEEKAASKLALADTYKANGMAAKAKEVLEGIVKAFPDTPAGKKAKEQLEEASRPTGSMPATSSRPK